jgi:hypothetical protein
VPSRTVSRSVFRARDLRCRARNTLTDAFGLTVDSKPRDARLYVTVSLRVTLRMAEDSDVMPARLKVMKP